MRYNNIIKYSTIFRKQGYAIGCWYLYFAQNLGHKYGQKLIDQTKKTEIIHLKLLLKKGIKKTAEATGNFQRNTENIVRKAKDSKYVHKYMRKDCESLENYIPKERYIHKKKNYREVKITRLYKLDGILKTIHLLNNTIEQPFKLKVKNTEVVNDNALGIYDTFKSSSKLQCYNQYIHIRYTYTRICNKIICELHQSKALNCRSYHIQYKLGKNNTRGCWKQSSGKYIICLLFT